MTNATGGIISYANGKKIHTFVTSGVLSVTEAGNVESLVVAGGGAGGGDYAATGTAFGGGGGGGVIYTSALTVGVGNVSVTIGDGGVSAQVAAGSITPAQNSVITDGNVNFTTQTAIAGGTFAQNGGSGGGGSGGGFGTGGTGTVGQGNDGGDVTNSFTGSAGGGGAGGAGHDAPGSDFTDSAGSGGDGVSYSISGTAERYGAGGGGGAWKKNAGDGGLGGGGNGGWADPDTNEGRAGSPGTGYGAGGGGQGGAFGDLRTGGAGHSGVVIFSYDSDFTTGRRVAQNEDLADMAASTIKGRITSTGIPQDLTAAQALDVVIPTVLPASKGGTGVANGASSTLTLPNAATTITGGGTLALGTFTLTVPATGSAALLALSGQVFTGRNKIDVGSGTAFVVGNSASLDNVLVVDTGNGNVGIGTTSTNISVLPTGVSVLTILGRTQRGVLELGNAAADADGLVLGDFRAVHPLSDATYRDKSAVIFQSQGTTAGKRGGNITFWTSEDNNTSIMSRFRITHQGLIVVGSADGTARFQVTGSTDIIQNRTLCHSTQTALAWTLETSAAAVVNSMSLTAGTVFNEQGTAAIDFRVESDTKTNMLFVDSSADAIGINQATPTAYLHVGAGSATAGTAPIKLTAGTVNTTPEAGTIEFDGSNFFLTI
jgi:hypothetical protein